MTKITSFFLGLIVMFGVFLSSTSSVKAYRVSGYTKSNGTYVNSYYRSRANAYTYDNYSYKAPTRSNGYGYNTSYYTPTYNYRSSWYTPSYYDSGYSYEKSYYNYSNY